jgi:enoyl-CoA hydratase
MGELLTHDQADGVSTITMDDGRVNALTVPMLEALHGAVDAAEEAGEIIVLTGRAETLSAGFDLKTIAERTDEMLGLGARLAERLFSFPRPVIVACNGNAVAMGAFLLLSADLRIGAEGDFRIGLNEVAIGLTLPRFGVALASHRLNPGWRDRAVLGGALIGPDDAISAGFLDRVVPGNQLQVATDEAVAMMAGVNEYAHAQTKLRVRARALEELREALATSGDGSW